MAPVSKAAATPSSKGMAMKRMMVLALAACCSMAVFAEPISGSRRALCTTEELRDCVAGTECLNGLPAEYGAPVAMRIDFANRQVHGEQRSTKIRDIEKKDGQILLQGREMGYGWTIAIETATGAMTLSLVNREGAFVLFGRCVKL